MPTFSTIGQWKETPKDTIDYQQVLNHTHDISAAVPAGAIIWFYKESAPDGWVICNGKYYNSNGVQKPDNVTDTNHTSYPIKTPNLINNYPLGADSNIGTEVEAGLPPITGYALSLQSIGKYGGAFTYKYNDASGVGAYDWGYHRGIYFDAKLSNPIYGKSKTVTPPSVKLLPCMKL